MASLSLVNITKKYKGDFCAVKKFNLEIMDKEFIIFVGPSGCGKSTTLRMIAGLEEITEGELWIDGKLVNFLEPGERDLSMVFQNYALYPHMTVYQNMAFGLQVHKVPKDEVEKRVLEAAKILEIDHLLDRKPHALSGGQRQRVAIGSVIVRKPKVFLMDEPLSNLDAKLRSQMRTELSKLHRKLDATIIYVTHDQVEAMTLGTRIVVMKDGVIQQVDAPTKLYENPVNKFVAGFIGSPAMNFIDVWVERRHEQIYLEFTRQQLLVDEDCAQRLEDGGYVGKRVTLGIRPENLHEEGQPEACLTMDVEIKEMLGAETYAYGQTGRESICARLKPDCNAVVGEEINLYVDMDRIHLFDIETGENILYL